MTTRRRTLLVDDADDLRQLIRFVLERSGSYEIVGEATDGHQAIELATTLAADLDLVLLDLSMPRMDGLEALPHLRRVAPDARVVVLSGSAETHTAEAARRAGAHLYLEKGLAPAAFLRALDEAVPGEDDPSPRRVVRPAVTTPPTSEVIGRLAHDVRTPLLTARGAVELVREELGTLAPDLEELVGRAEAALDRVDRTLTAAVEHARAGAAPLTPVPVEVREVLADVVTTIGPHAVARTALHGPHRQVMADRDALRRIAINLLDNALRYSDGGVEVVVATDSDGRVALEVRDHGPGFGQDPETLFAPFERGAAGRGHPGTGLGLATAADLTRRLGGELSASDGPDGTTVTLRLPAAP